MKHIKVLGSGCANCKATYARIEQVAKDKGVSIVLEKIEDIAQMMTYGIMSTPAVVIDEKVVHAGGIPDPQTIATWL
jgi:small redox-active disulfide protein 2